MSFLNSLRSSDSGSFFYKLSNRLLIAAVVLTIVACGGGSGGGSNGGVEPYEAQLSEFAGEWTVVNGVESDELSVAPLLIADDGFISMNFVFPPASVDFEGQVTFHGYAELVDGRLIASFDGVVAPASFNGQPYVEPVSIMIELDGNGSAFITIDHPLAAFDDLQFNYTKPLDSGERPVEMARTWYTLSSLFAPNTTGVTWVLDIDSDGNVTGSYDGVCALTGSVEGAYFRDILYRISLSSSGCVAANEYEGVILFIELGSGQKIFILQLTDTNGDGASIQLIDLLFVEGPQAP